VSWAPAGEKHRVSRQQARTLKNDGFRIIDGEQEPGAKRERMVSQRTFGQSAKASMK
jgi:hypothetical protein